LTTALAGSGPDRAELARQLSALTQRVFLMRNVHDDAPVLMKSRWALSYLRGPLTPMEISRLMASRKNGGASAGAGVANIAATDSDSGPGNAALTVQITARPAVPAGVEEVFAPVSGDAREAIYIPRMLGAAKLHFIDKSLNLDHWQSICLAAPLSDDGSEALWDQADVCDSTLLSATPVEGIGYVDLPAGALREANYARYGKTLAAQLYQSQRLTIFRCDEAKLASGPEESEGEFRTRLALTVREQRDARKQALRQKYAAKIEAARKAVDRTQDQAQLQQVQATQQKFDTAISIGATVLGALFGRKKISAGSLSGAATAARRAQRIGRESGQAQRAAESHEDAQTRYENLEKELADELAALDTALDAQTLRLTRVSVAPRKSDIAVTPVRLLWRPA
jgi:hypothetical protein